jgi:site-specific DNA-methyltransferase (adenine-specific)
LPRNQRNKVSATRFMQQLRAGEAKLAFLDPQYRGNLEKLAYGNEGARQIERAKLPQMSDDLISFLIEEMERALAPSGHLMLWIDKFSLGSGHHLRYFARAPKLALVDVIHWHTMRFGMGYRTRGGSEYLLVIQKHPTKAKGTWSDKSLRDSWSESTDRSQHPHAKPIALIERLIRATTTAKDLVIDPCAGSYVVLEACRRTGRAFAGSDILTPEEEC